MKLKKRKAIFGAIIFLFMIMLSASVFVGCRDQGITSIDDFEISLYWDTGSLPPQYHYYYFIKLDSTLNGYIEYQPGYGDPPAPEVWKSNFTINRSNLEVIYLLLEKNNFFRNSWEKTEPSIGGSYNSITIKKEGKTYKIPGDFELKKDDALKVGELSNHIRGLVPDQLWEEIKEMQQKFENTYENLNN